MKLYFWIKSKGGKRNLDDSKFGNYGIGGIEFELSIVPCMLREMYPYYDIHIYTDNIELKSDSMAVHYVTNSLEMIDKISKEEGVLIFAQDFSDKIFFERLNRTEIQAIGWVHNYLTFLDYVYLQTSPNIKRVVFVGRQLYDHYIDTTLIKKATYIYNCVPYYKKIDRRISICEPKIMFVGAFSKQKGFHVLAKAWKRILKVYPNAQLYVAGGKQYSDNGKIDRYYVYCKKFLTDKRGNLLDGVHFLGILGDEKRKYYESVSVGVANPTGKTETFCLSAVEFEAHEVPVVTYDGFGLLDTVINEKTGICVRGAKKLAKAILRLIKNTEFNRALGINGRKFVCSIFTPEHVIPKWHWLITDGLYLEKMPDEFSYANYLDDWKWLRYINSRIQKMFHLKGKLSVQGVGTWSRWRLKRLGSK